MRFVSWKRLLVIAIANCLWSCWEVQGQNTDCVTAQIICSDGPITFAPNGPGIDDFANPNNKASCLAALEKESAWYYFEFREDMPPNSVLEFTILPFINPIFPQRPDYDFAIFGPDLKCDSLGEPLRCSFAIWTCSLCPETGLGKGATDTHEPAADSDGFLAPMVVQPGEGYYMLLDNFRGDATGFNLTWGGSAAPYLNCLANPLCKGKSADAGADLQFCQSPAPTPVTLNASAKNATSRVKYEWQGTPQALSFLNDKTLLQPTATIPANFTGSLDYILTIKDGDCVTADDITITVTPNPPAQLRADTVICPGESATIRLNNAYQSYQWSNGASTPTINVSTGGNYSVTVSNGGGCSDTATIRINQRSAPQVSIEGGSAICSGEALTLRTNPAFSSYAWSNNTTNPGITVSTGGNYSVTVTDANGCRASATVAVRESPKPTPQITGTTTFCEGQTTTLSTSTTYMAYQWSSGQTTPTISSGAAGLLGVTVTDANGCKGSDTITLIRNTSPTLNVTGKDIFCTNSSTQLTATTNATQINWSNGATTPGITVNTPGTYIVTAGATGGCQRKDTVVVRQQPLPQPTLINRVTICPQSSATLTPQGTFVTYEWSNGARTPSITVSQPGNYTLQVTDSVGCVGSAATTVEAFPTVSKPTITGATSFCPSAGTTLTASGNFTTFNWSNGATTAAIQVVNTGTYTVTARDANGCTSQDSVRVQAFVVTAPTPDTAAFCTGGSTTFNAGVYRNYSWSTGSTQPSIQVNRAGVYTVTVTDQNGCQSNAAYTATESTPPQVTLSGNTRFCVGGSTQLSATPGLAAYRWSNNATTPTITVQTPGGYRVTVTDRNGCTATQAISVSTLPLPTLGITGTVRLCANERGTLSVNNNFATYRWSDGSQQRNLTITQGGRYSVTVTDQNTCEGSASIDVSAFPASAVTIQADSVICQGSSTRLTATPGFRAYQWSNGGNRDTTRVSRAGSYTVTVTDLNNCRVSDTIQITQVDLPIANAGQDQTLDCNIKSVQIGSTATPIGPYRFTWTGPGITATTTNFLQPTVNQAGTYQLVITDTLHQCQSAPARMQVVDQTYTPQIRLQLQDTLDCNTPSVTLNAADSQPLAAGLQFQWYDAQRLPLVNGQGLQLNTTQPGRYFFELKDPATGCQAIDSILVLADFDPSFVDAGLPKVLNCKITQTTLKGKTSSEADHILYQWISPSGADISNQMTVNVDQPGWYILTITNAKNGCSNRDSVEVKLDRMPPVVSAGADQSLDCTVKTASLQGNVTAGDDSVVYTWTTTADFIFNNPNQLTQTVNKPGTYTLQAQNLRNGCTALDSAMVSEDANYPTAVDLELINPTCFGFTNGQIQIKNVTGGTGPYLLSLNGSPLESVQRFNNLGAGKYDLIVEDVAGCDFKTEVILKEETELRVTLGADTTIRLGDVLTLEPFVNIPTQNIAKIEWDGKDKYGDCRDNCWLQSVSPKDSASYKVTVTSKNGCQASDVLLVKVLSSRSVYVPTGFSPNGDGYNDIFVIYGGREVVQIKSLKIMDRWGNQVFQAAGFRPNDPMRGWDGNIDGAKDPTPAVFAWIAEIEFLDGTSEFFWGDLTLVR